jgi:putative FmdB family regulatory protein
MPSYDLECVKCGHRFSVFCSISQKDHQTCPQCGCDQIKQRLTSVNIGSGVKGSQGGRVAAPSRFG